MEAASSSKGSRRSKKKEKDGASSSAPKDVTKVTSKRKSEGEDDRPLKKVVPVGGKLKKSSPLKPSHGVGKDLMTLTGLVT